MGSERSRYRVSRYSLRAMRFLPHRVSAINTQGPDPRHGERSVRVENFSQGILLRGLPFYLEQRRTARIGAFLAPFLSGSGAGEKKLVGNPAVAARDCASRA